MDVNSIVKEVFEIESKAIANLVDNLTDDLEKAIQDIIKCKGKLIVSGMGKSGIIGKKIAATLASTGTPSFFLHPSEAYHGDLGMIGVEDIILLISNSGETDEVLKLIPFLKSQQNIICAMSGNINSTLAKNSTYHFNIKIEKEACPLQLAPTTSTTATLVMGDALAIALMRLRGFKEQDYAQFHPGGSLGRRVLTKVENIMKRENLPIVNPDDNVKNIIQTLSSGKMGLSVVVEKNKIVGIITDGDIRRAMENCEESFFSLSANELMSPNPKTISGKAKLTLAQEMMTEYKINSLLVSNNQELIGIIEIYDLGI
ncbi:MAG TPA: KpsF/GutQ family sugar-phosphate isomerase [Campylobacterales bacterium]|nr:KpsF/GutQ family sugar-phosphate isomerase [Campylobacterales bacterium]